MASWVPTASMTRVGAEAAGELLDLRDTGVAALLDDVGGAELAGERLPVGVAAERDDALGAELLGGQDAEQADRAVTDDRDGLARAGLGGDGGEPAGAEHVGGRHQRRDEVRVRLPGGRDEGAVGERDAGQLGLGAEGAHQDAVHAVRLVAGLADLAGVVGGPEGADDEVADLDGADLGADLLDDADVLVAHHLVVDRLGAAVGPQVAAADAGRRQADDRVGRLDDLRVLAVLDPHVPGPVHDNLTHRGVLLFVASSHVSWHRHGATTPSEPAGPTGWKSLSMGVLTGHPSSAPVRRRRRPRLDDVDNRSQEVREFLTTRRARSPRTRSASRPPAAAACPGCGAARSPPSPG